MEDEYEEVAAEPEKPRSRRARVYSTWMMPKEAGRSLRMLRATPLDARTDVRTVLVDASHYGSGSTQGRLIQGVVSHTQM